MNKHTPQRMAEEQSELLDSLNNKIAMNVFCAEYSRVIAGVVQLDGKRREELLALCIPALDEAKPGNNMAIRVSLVRLIVALLPLSLETVANLLAKHSEKQDYEVHFTLFCYLDWVQEMRELSWAENVLQLVQNYLMTVPLKTARAAWMAGDMLGTHWNQVQAIPVLITTVRYSQYSVGRQASILGLEKIISQIPETNEIRKQIVEVLQEVSLNDRSGRVKADATAILKRLN